MVTAKFINTYGWVVISVMALLLVLVWFKALPDPLPLIAFIVAVLLFIGRLVLRILLARQNRRLGEESSTDGPLDRQ